MEKLTLTRKEAAAILGISTATVTQWVKSGRLRAIKISEKEKSRYLFTREDCIDALKHDQMYQPPLQQTNPISLANSTPPASSNTNKNNAAKRLDELLKQRSTNIKRSSSCHE
ncbi:helix-turn-helix domain-containing protein [Pantoea sp. KPR_PJ]|uniref:helix-turn-helix domain-containing protein n=1 Tax=Pantoea sp. KPR_PJ TaxID=2738375 RepID=UPI0035297CC1